MLVSMAENVGANKLSARAHVYDVPAIRMLSGDWLRCLSQ